MLRVGHGFLLDPTLKTNPKLHLQKVLPCRHPMHFILGTPCELVLGVTHACKHIHPMFGEILGHNRLRCDHGVFKSSRLQIAIFQFLFTNVRYVPWIRLKRVGLFFEVLMDFNRFIYNKQPFLHVCCLHLVFENE